MEIYLKSTSFSKTEFLELIEELRTIFKENEWCFRASEENVRAELIDPILKVLGWETPYLKREFNRMDYILCNDKYLREESVKLVIEAKKYREQLRTDKQENGTEEAEEQYNQENSELHQNQTQIVRYMRKNNIQYGILTNGIRWCLYFGDNSSYLGEINIQSSNEEDIYSFFYSISKSQFKNINQFDNSYLSINNEHKPSIIRIDEQEYTSNYHCEASYKVAILFINECEKNGWDPFHFTFSKMIISKDIPKIKKRKRKSKSKKSRRKQLLYTPHVSEYLGKPYYLIGDYNIFDKLTLLQEINSTLDLGLTITAE